jgi:hypothetical protein
MSIVENPESEGRARDPSHHSRTELDIVQWPIAAVGQCLSVQRSYAARRHCPVAQPNGLPMTRRTRGPDGGKLHSAVAVSRAHACEGNVENGSTALGYGIRIGTLPGDLF